MSEAFIFASTNPQYDNRLFIELPVQYMKIPSLEHVVYTNWFFVFYTQKSEYINEYWFTGWPNIDGTYGMLLSAHSLGFGNLTKALRIT